MSNPAAMGKVSEQPVPVAPRRGWLVAALLMHFSLGGYYLARLPLWGAVPDEPLHYSTIKYDAEFLRQPVITNPRPWAEPLAVYCFTADPVGAGGHGPLYYWTCVPVFWLTRGLTVAAQQLVLRGWTLLLSSLLLWFAWRGLQLACRDDLRPVGPALLVIACWPHRLMLSAVIYNDIAVATMGALAVWLLWRAAPLAGRRPWLLAGAAFGLAFLGKRSGLVLLPGCLLLPWLWPRQEGRRWRAACRQNGAWLLGAALVGGWWLWRDLWIYGRLFPTEPGFEEHYTNALWLWFAHPEIFWFKVRLALPGLWLSLWSQVGWVPLDVAAWRPIALALYGSLAVASGLTVVGLVGACCSRRRRLTGEPRALLGSAAVMVLGMVYGALHWVVQYSLHNHQETGKHALVVLLPLLLLVVTAGRWLAGPDRVAPLLVALAVLLLSFNVASIVRLEGYLIPTWRPPTPNLAGERVRDLPSGVAPGIWHRYRVPGTIQRGGAVPPPPAPGEGWHG
ncbi:MAG: glycosyltransferase family 39 protein [Fimbriimonadaceae bacterium]|nr:glycosyltransferase family 39 protein [Fimbriimonadaceae bacterium]